MKSVGGRASKNRGVVLVVVMIFMLLLAILSETAMQTGILEFQMVANERFREEAVQAAQGIASAISGEDENFRLELDVGSSICREGDISTDCEGTRYIALDSGLETLPPGVDVIYRVERRGPKLLPSMPLRMPQSSVSSSLAYNAAIFEVRVMIDGGNVNLGVADIAQGVALLVASSSGESAE